MRACLEPNCDKPFFAKGYCQVHYLMRVYVNPRKCSVDDCDRPAHGAGMCIKHWRYWRRHGRPEPLSDQERFWSHVDKSGDCWVWTAGRSPFGYGQFSRDHHPVAAHRASWEFANGPIPDGLFVLHHCDNPPCVRPDHLYLGTQKDNIRDAIERNRKAYGERCYTELRPRGETHGMRKLTEAQVREIRKRHQSGSRGSNSSTALAREFGVTRITIQMIARGQTWSHIGDTE